MIIKLKYVGSETEIYLNGIYFLKDEYVQLEEYQKFKFQTDIEIENLINSSDLIVNSGSNDIANTTAAISYLRSASIFSSSFAVDLDNTDQLIDSDIETIISANRILWDILEDYSLTDQQFNPPIDGVWNANGTIAVKNPTNVKTVAIEIWRNDEPWFTVSQQAPSPTATTFLPFSCDVDAYASESHYFDLRIHLTKEDALLPCEITISGSDEETAWGMTFSQQLVSPSPT